MVTDYRFDFLFFVALLFFALCLAWLFLAFLAFLFLVAIITSGKEINPLLL